MCPGILHVFERPQALLRALDVALAPGGELFVSALVTDRAFGARYLRLLQRSGEVPTVLSTAALSELVAAELGRDVETEVQGNFANLRVARDSTGMERG